MREYLKKDDPVGKSFTPQVKICLNPSRLRATNLMELDVYKLSNQA